MSSLNINSAAGFEQPNILTYVVSKTFYACCLRTTAKAQYPVISKNCAMRKPFLIISPSQKRMYQHQIHSNPRVCGLQWSTETRCKEYILEKLRMLQAGAIGLQVNALQHFGENVIFNPHYDDGVNEFIYSSLVSSSISPSNNAKIIRRVFLWCPGRAYSEEVEVAWSCIYDGQWSCC